MSEEEPKGFRLLSLDGGGPRGLSQGYIVKEIMSRVEHDEHLASAPPVRDYFDVISGSGTGSIWALFYYIGMTAQEAIDAFSNLHSIFSDVVDINVRTENFESALKDIVKSHTSAHDPDFRLLDDLHHECKIILCASPTNNMSHPRIFRNYTVRENRSENCPLWQAVGASTAVPGLFHPMAIGGTYCEEEFSDGGLGWNNPSKVLAGEMTKAFEDRHISQFVSIGAGHPGVIAVENPAELGRMFKKISMDCLKVAEEMQRRFEFWGDVFVRLDVEQGLQDVESDHWNRTGEIRTHTHAYLTEHVTSRYLDHVIGALCKPAAVIPCAWVGAFSVPLRRPKPLKECPRPSDLFVGRRALVNRLDTYFASGSEGQKRAVLVGLGGRGKSQAGYKFVAESQKHSRFSAVFFVDASSQQTLEADLAAIAFAKVGGQGHNESIEWLCAQHTEWLLFFNNADDPTLDLGRYIPRCSNGNILVTTRNQEMCHHAPNCTEEVGDLEVDEATDLLLQGVTEPDNEDTRAAAEAIVKELHCLPLAVAQARAYMNQCCPLREYLNRYRRSRAELLNHRGIQSDSDYDHTVHTTWLLSYEKLGSLSSRFMRILAFMHYEGITEAVFHCAAMNITTDSILDKVLDSPGVTSALEFLLAFSTERDTWDCLQFFEIIRNLMSFSLPDYDPVNLTMSMHPLVHFWTRNIAVDAGDTSLTSQVILAFSFSQEDTTENLKHRRSLLAHVHSSLGHGDTVVHWLSQSLAIIYGDCGLANEGGALWGEIVEERRHHLGEEHLDTLTGMNNLASCYNAQGRLPEATDLGSQVLEIRQRTLGEEHPSTLISMNNLAGYYDAQGRLSEAIDLGSQVLEISQRTLGEEHPSTLTSMSNLAGYYDAQGRLPEATDLGSQVLEIRQRTLGEEHPSTLTSMSNLAGYYKAQGRLSEAIDLSSREFEICRRTLGEEHPSTVISMSNLAGYYDAQGRLPEATDLGSQVLEIRQRTLGEEHPSTLTSMSNLAGYYKAQGRLSEAIDLGSQVLEIRQRTLGEEHPSTLTSMSNLAGYYKAQGRLSEAIDLSSREFEICRRTLGEEHPSTVISMSNLAGYYDAQGRLSEATDLGSQVLEIHRRTLGEEHPSTLISMSNLAGYYDAQGRLPEATDLGSQVLEIRQRTLGEEHPSTLTSMNNLAAYYAEQSRFNEAEELSSRAADIGFRIFGTYHQRTWDFKENHERICRARLLHEDLGSLSHTSMTTDERNQGSLGLEQFAAMQAANSKGIDPEQVEAMFIAHAIQQSAAEQPDRGSASQQAQCESSSRYFSRATDNPSQLEAMRIERAIQESKSGQRDDPPPNGSESICSSAKGLLSTDEKVAEASRSSQSNSIKNPFTVEETRRQDVSGGNATDATSQITPSSVQNDVGAASSQLSTRRAPRPTAHETLPPLAPQSPRTVPSSARRDVAIAVPSEPTRPNTATPRVSLQRQESLSPTTEDVPLLPEQRREQLASFTQARVDALRRQPPIQTPAAPVTSKLAEKTPVQSSSTTYVDSTTPSINPTNGNVTINVPRELVDALTLWLRESANAMARGGAVGPSVSAGTQASVSTGRESAEGARELQGPRTESVRCQAVQTDPERESRGGRTQMAEGDVQRESITIASREGSWFQAPGFSVSDIFASFYSALSLI